MRRERSSRALARQAFRRPVTDADTEFLMNYYQEGRSEGNFETGIRMAVQAIIANPKFVFRFETAPRHMPLPERTTDQRPRTGVAAVVFPVEQPTRRTTAERSPHREN